MVKKNTKQKKANTEPKCCIYCFGELKRGLTDEEIRKFFKIEFGKYWYAKYRSFGKFMTGQTTGAVAVNGELINITYRCDVANFMRPEGERFFD